MMLALAGVTGSVIAFLTVLAMLMCAQWAMHRKGVVSLALGATGVLVVLLVGLFTFAEAMVAIL